MDTDAFLRARAHDRTAVTYAGLAAAAGLGAADAQNALAQFAAARTDVHVVYAVSGTRDSRRVVELVAAAHVADAAARLAHARTYAYALQPTPTPDAALLAAAGRELLCGQKAGEAAKPAEPPAEPAADPRKKRKVVRTIRTKNEKGYTVTRDVEVEEAEEGEVEPKPPTKPAPKPAPKPTTKPPPKQASLAAFFKK